MSRGGGGFPIIIAVLGVLILGVIGIFVYMQMRGDADDNPTDLNNLPTTNTPDVTNIPTLAPVIDETPEVVITVPPVTEAPTTEADATETPYITAPPVYNSGTVWINVDALLIHTQANFTSDTVGKIPYGQSVSGDISGKWMNTTHDGASGYIYLGKTSAGRACVVYSESSLAPLEPDPDAEEQDLFDGIISCSASGENAIIILKFTGPVFADDNGTGNLTASDFTVSTGAIIGITHMAGTDTVTLTVHISASPAGTSVTVTVNEQSVFNAAGQACFELSDTETVS